MAVRKIEYTVSADGIEPAVKQFAGVQGDHKATELIFNIDTTLYESLTEQSLDGGKLIYRFDGYDGEGGLCRSDTRDLTKTVTYSLEEWLTRFGGIVKVVLVISLLNDDLTEMELFSFPALLQLKNLPEGTETDGESYESMSVLAQVAKDSANTAVSSAEVAVDAKEKTELARAALENGTVWVFDGGDAEGNVDLDGDGVPDTNTADIKFVIDGEMSDSSENAVKNKVVKAYVDAVSKDLEKTDKTVDSNKQEIDELKEQLSFCADYIIEQGTHGIWHYEKWKSGKCELSATDVRNLEFSDSNQQGSLYRSNNIYVGLPFPIYNCRAFFDCTDINAWASAGPIPDPTSAVVFFIWRGFPYELIEYRTHIYVVGRWK